MPAAIPQKETLALLVAILPNPKCLVGTIKTATDVLRIAVALSDGDVSLAEPTIFRNFSKRERRFLLACLEETGKSCVEDMLRRKQRWIRLGERLHPGDFKKVYPKSFDAFDTIRNNKPVATFNKAAEAAIKKRDTIETFELLMQRPGDFARRLDHVLRTHEGSHQSSRGIPIGGVERVDAGTSAGLGALSLSKLYHRARILPQGKCCQSAIQGGGTPAD